MDKITFDEMWKRLEKYLRVDKALEQGYSNGKYTKILAGYAKHVIGIDLSNDFYEIATNNLQGIDNIELKIMDATKTTFRNKEFDVLLNTSFHEFDLSHSTFSMDLDLKRRILEEMMRLSNVIVFIEPTEEAVTNELFKVFDYSEDHSLRIKESNNLIKDILLNNGYKLELTGLTYNEDRFKDKKDLEENMLDWWADIKVPQTIEEKNKMISEIDEILKRANMLEDLRVVEDIRFNVFVKGE